MIRRGGPGDRQGRLWLAAMAIFAAAWLGAPARGNARGRRHAPSNTAPQSGVFGDPSVWRWPPSRTYHVVNYKLELHFDQAKGEVFGDETVTLQPFGPGFQSFYLNSSGLEIESVRLESERGTEVPLRFSTKGDKLWVYLDHGYGRGARLNVRVIYHGFPHTGLYFVNPTPAYPRWPREIWSQGEPEFNHFWFPCWDYPNDMATSETITTVPDGQSVVSNGRLVRVTHAAGEATYDWVESVPHSSYLTSIAIGPWRKVADSYEGKPVDYYVPRSVDEATARRSFHLTTDMLAFFSRITGVDYPYEQYAQTTVHNYIFGGMENVSATTLYEWTLHDQRADADYPSTGIVSHELGQHWFGDLVQGRDWADIWLNEGFATYLEAMYTGHHEGNDAFRYEIYQDQMAEQNEERMRYRRPIVDRHYTDPLRMFDATTHEKGAAVLEMMRYVVDGPAMASQPPSPGEPFFQALHRYLVAHRARTTVTADLADSIRSTTGKELGWFFHEWVFLAGHPDYRVEASYDSAARVERVTVRQTQAVSASIPIFDMPIELGFYGVSGQHESVQVRDHLAEQTFNVPLNFRPQWVDFDPDNFIDKTVRFDQPIDAWIAEAEKDPAMMSRLEAAQELGRTSGAESDQAVTALGHVLQTDTFYGVRATAAASLGTIGTASAKSALLAALRESDSRVRSAVVSALGSFAQDREVSEALISVLRNDPSYAVEAAAATDLGRSPSPEAFQALAAKATERPEVHVMQATLSALAATGNPRAIAILVTSAKPGQMERSRLSALAGLAKLAKLADRGQREDMLTVGREAASDPFALTQNAGRVLLEALGVKS